MKKFFIGIDVSKETIDVSVISRGEEETPENLAYGKFENAPRGFVRMLAMVRKEGRKYGANDTSFLFCCECTGSYDSRLCGWLVGRGQFIWRESALQIKRSLGLRRGKDDKSDSEAIAMYAMRHADKAVCYEPDSPALAILRELIVYRKQLVERRAACQARLEQMRCLSEPLRSRFITRDLVDEINDLKERVSLCEAEMEKSIGADEEISRTYGTVRSFCGVGLICAAAIIAYSGNFKRVSSPRSMACYCGLVTFYADSGTSVHHRDGTKHICNKELKAYLTNAALCAIKYNPPIAQYYRRMLEKGKLPQVAKNNIKHKILHILYAMVKNDSPFDEGYEDLHKKNAKVA